MRKAYIRRQTKYLPADAQHRVISTGMELIIGAIAGALAQIFTIPVSVIATRQQLYVEPSVTEEVVKGVHPKENSFLSVAREIIKEDGVTGLWAGLKPGLVLTVNPAITYGVYERMKTALLHDGEKFSPWTSFLVGAFSKTLATVVRANLVPLPSYQSSLKHIDSQVTYPYIMAKVRLQAGPKEEVDLESPPSIVVQETGSMDGSSYADIKPITGMRSSYTVPSNNKPRVKLSAVELLRKVYKEHGFAGWYQVSYNRSLVLTREWLSVPL